MGQGDKLIVPFLIFYACLLNHTSDREYTVSDSNPISFRKKKIFLPKVIFIRSE